MAIEATRKNEKNRKWPVKKVVSYCGLCGAERSSGGKMERALYLETKKQTTPHCPSRGDEERAARDCPIAPLSA
jgi:hypothetical protein